MARGEDIRSRVEKFNAEFAPTGLTILNTIDPLAMKLVSWNPEFAVPNASWIFSQRRTLNALARFARDKHVKIRVRFITWGEAFGLLSEIDPGKHSENDPDVAEIGSTWAAHFASKRLTMSRPGWDRDRANWKDVLDLPASALPYAIDARMLFYWKRLPSAASNSEELALNASSWQSVVESVRNQGSSGDTIAFPTGLTLNLLHDYIPLIWSGGGTFEARGWAGARVDLTSTKALAVPIFLAQNGRIEPRPGEPRRLIAFPESTHEEVSRIFVNGGYRVTLEPAHFIDRWRQDFAKRDPQNRSFWDYAGAVVPPVPFKGGSELVVMRGTKHAELAFSLADFLATDLEFTEVLAEHGHLPASRPGYGIDILVRTISDRGNDPEAQAFGRSVQKAIDQGRAYPDLSAWPMAVENQQVLEQLQIVWRRMAEGNVEGLRNASKQLEWTINARQNWAYSLLEHGSQSWEILAVVLLATGTLTLYLYLRQVRARSDRVKAQAMALQAEQENVRAKSERLEADEARLRAEAERVQAERNLVLLLHLNRAHRHDAAKFLGDNFHDMSLRAKHEGWPLGKLQDEIKDLSAHFRDQLAPYINEITENQLREIRGEKSVMGLHEIVLKAFDGARYIFRAMKMTDPPYVRFIPGVLSGWRLEKFPYAAVVILEEWFLNCLKHVDSNDLKAPVISIGVEQGELCIHSPGTLNGAARDVVAGRITEPEFAAVGLGLPLIRDILHYAYGVSAKVESIDTDKRIELRLPFPLRAAQGGVR
ncbi:MAG TPA: hypothetical protein VG759_22070 [Candidatus Angelobacter sp.]|nr:hypothetical protein [Candidatus Angelobacter sp.]